jgi:hypothetical protein
MLWMLCFVEVCLVSAWAYGRLAWSAHVFLTDYPFVLQRNSTHFHMYRQINFTNLLHDTCTRHLDNVNDIIVAHNHPNFVYIFGWTFGIVCNAWYRRTIQMPTSTHHHVQSVSVQGSIGITCTSVVRYDRHRPVTSIEPRGVIKQYAYPFWIYGEPPRLCYCFCYRVRYGARVTPDFMIRVIQNHFFDHSLFATGFWSPV